MAPSRQLQQASGSAPAPAPSATAPANITVVRTGPELQQATLSGAQDIEIRAHLDMRDMHRIANPLVKGVDYGQRRKEQAVLYASRPLRSIRGNCEDPDVAGALGLSNAEASALVPLKPFQCLVLIAEPWLMVNNGEVWLDNVHLQMRRTLVQPIFWMISAGASNGAFQDPITGSDIYATNVTFQAEQRGTAMAMVADVTGVSVYVEDCIIADWASFRSPFSVKFQSVFHIRNTLFLNSHISAELVDVSQEGVVHMHNVSLANVTLDRGAIVSTTLNDYQQAIGYIMTYYADDDEAFDVPVEVVPIAERGVFGAEFVVVNSTLGDCVYLLADENVIEPGCPPESVARREEMKERAAGRAAAVPFEVANIGAPLPAPAYAEPYDYPVAGEEDLGGILQLDAEQMEDYLRQVDPSLWFYDRFLTRDWIDSVQQELPARPPPPDTWRPEPFKAAPPANRTSVRPSAAVIPPETANRMLGPMNITAGLEAERAAAAGGGGGLDAAAIVGIAVAAIALALAAALFALWSWRPTKQYPPGSARGSKSEHAMLVGFPSGSAANGASNSSVSQGGRNLPRGALIPEDYPVEDSNMLNSVMHPSARTSETRGAEVGSSMFGQDLKSSETGSGVVVEGELLRGAYPEAIYYSSTQPSESSGEDTGQETSANCVSILGPHHRRMMEVFSKGGDEEPPVVTSTGPAVPFSTTKAVNKTVDGTIEGTVQGTVDGTIEQTTLSASETEAAVSPSLLVPCEIQVTRPADGGPGAALALADDETRVRSATGATERAMRRLLKRLDTFGKHDLLLGRYQVLGRQQRRLGGQGLVQFVRGASDRRHYAVKFFHDPDAFFVEAALYAACFPEILTTLSPEIAARAVDLAAASSRLDKVGPIKIPAAAARFLPQVELVCDGAAGDLVDPTGKQLPPCIVMEKGESLQDWSSRAEPDLFTVLGVLSNISQRLADMHDAGYVHRDLKPANVMWLPRENRWTVIDFGCIAGIGEVATLSFTLAYAAPEVVAAFSNDEQEIATTEALDAWSLGVMAYEMLSGDSAFDFLTHGRCRVIAQLKGELPLPWEGNSAEANKRKLGAFKAPVLQLLERDPARRISMRRFHDICTRLFESHTTESRETQ